MNRFVFKVPQIAVVITALAMSVLTLGVAIAPAQLEASAPPAYATVRDSAAIEVDIIPARIDVVGATRAANAARRRQADLRPQGPADVKPIHSALAVAG
jgi:hypothetical protein